MTKREQLIAWLGDAHAMEVGIVSTLEKHAADAKGQPKVRGAITKHLSETKKHATAMKQALASLGGSHPVIREGISKVVNLVAGLGTSAVKDTPVKNAIADFATEHFEIACYTSLFLTATELGEKKIADTCKAILKEEKAMAKTLEALFPQVNTTYLASLDDEEAPSATATPAKRPAKRTTRKS
jgi:ferritin-like metal-binding protein YciE